MSFSAKLEQIMFFYGFQECKQNKNLNFLKLNENEYLMFRIFKKDTADLMYARFHPNSNPCLANPIIEKSIKLSFSPDEDQVYLKSFIEEFKK